MPGPSSPKHPPLTSLCSFAPPYAEAKGAYALHLFNHSQQITDAVLPYHVNTRR